MRVKELNNKIAHVVWSPSAIYPTYIAAGTASEQLDATIGTKPQLELFKFDLANPNVELETTGSIVSEARFSKLLWTNYESANARNLIIGGCENSKIYLYDYEKIVQNKDASSVVQVLDKHAAGAVSALDVNPFQKNLLASGGSSSDILIWDLNNPGAPMTPGAKLQPLDDINCVAWNNQVQHILGSTCAGKCVVWDLRKNESIIKVSDNMSKMKAKLVAWHPDVATQMCLSSEDDHTPLLQLWDLRYATSPVRILEGHKRGILTFTWCSVDSNLLISSAKDNRIICWNPNNTLTNGEILYDLPTSGQWCFDVSWCKRNPDLICASSFEGQINVYSLMGGKYNVVHQASSKIMDSFGVDTNTPVVPVEQQHTTQVVQQLKIAPKWMKRPCGASFGFGGKLVTFGRSSNEIQVETNQADQLTNQRITIQQVITDSNLVEKSQHLESTLQTGNFIEYCNYKIETAENETQSFLWKFIQASFSANKNATFLDLLGINSQSLESKINQLVKLNYNDENDFQNSNELEKLNDDINSALNLNGGTNNLFDQNKFNNEETFNEAARTFSPVNLTFNKDTENLISKLLLLGKYEIAIELCVQEDRFTEAILIANYFDKNLLAKTQTRYFRKHKSKFTNLLETFLNRDWQRIVSTCNLEDWKEALAGIMTYTSGQELFTLCDNLGSRLESDDSNLLNACVCYIFSSNLDNLINCWQKLSTKINPDTSSDSSTSLQDLIEKIMILKCTLNDRNKSFDKLNSKLVKYAKLLADQGCFLNAYSYINDSNDSSILVMKDRLYHVLDNSLIQKYKLKKPEYPFKAVNIPSNIKSNIAQQTQHQTTHIASTRKPSYPTVADRSATPNSYAYPTVQTNVNNKIMPVNHPMPLSSIYASQPNNTFANQNNLINTHPPISTYPQPTPSGINQINSFSQASTTQAQTAPPTTNFNTNPSSLYNPTANVANPVANQQPAMPSYMHTKPPVAWNDPPIVAPKIKPPPSSVREIETPAFFQPTVPTQSNIPAMQQNFYQPTINQQPQQNQFVGFNQPLPFQQQQQQQQQMSDNQKFNNFNQSQPFNPNVNIQQQATQVVNQPVQQEKPIVTEKGPIPAEHQIIKTVFDTLLNKCLNATTVPTTKRKLEDVFKKQEILYDKLRDSTLSPGVVNGLHSMIQYIQTFDYPTCLQLHSQIVATSNFTEISGFMPGIKVLIQSCQQMNITI